MRTTEEIKERKDKVFSHLYNDFVNISLLMKKTLRPYEEQVSFDEYDCVSEETDIVDDYVGDCLEKFVDLLEKEEVLFNEDIIQNLRTLFDLDENFSIVESLND